MRPPPSLLLELTRRYSEPHRHYHTLEHIASMLHAGRGLDLTDEQVLGIWFHDAVYDATRDDNEERSAELAETMLRGTGHHVEAVATVARIVRDTKAHTPTIEPSALVIDLDLMSLALPWEQFAANSAAIRREYAHVPEEDFRRGRREFLQRMLQRPRLYWTAFGATLEARARENLQRTIEL